MPPRAQATARDHRSGQWDFTTFTVSASRSVESQTVSSGGPTTLTSFLPALLVLPNALYGLRLMRRIGKTHVQPER